MTLTDTGPLVALLDRDERDHARCVEQLRSVSGPMLTTWPVLTEAMHLVGDGLGWRGQEALWSIFRRGDLQLAQLQASTADRMERLMSKYRDLPMDVGDASLVAVAEEHGLTTVFSLDCRFRVYRVLGKRPFIVLP